jgi:ubiquitin-conjugating enzyme E2 variant
MQTTPFFKDATPANTWVMRFFVGANIAVIAFCALYLVRHFAAAGLSWPSILAVALAGYFLADFAFGAVHWSMDTWFDERMLGRAIAIVREHITPIRITSTATVSSTSPRWAQRRAPWCSDLPCS